MAARRYTSGRHAVAAAERSITSNLTQPAAAINFSTSDLESVLVKAADANAGKVFLGPTGVTGATNGYELSAGQSFVLSPDELDTLFTIGTAGDFVHLLGTTQD